jgi:hypothetical protein
MFSPFEGLNHRTGADGLDARTAPVHTTGARQAAPSKSKLVCASRETASSQ